MLIINSFLFFGTQKASAAFIKLNNFFNCVKNWLSSRKLQLNPDQNEVFNSKLERERLKAYFPVDILGSPLQPAELVKMPENPGTGRYIVALMTT